MLGKLVEIGILVAVDFLLFQSLHKAFTSRIIVGIGWTAHARDHMVGLENRSVFGARILGAPVGVMHHSLPLARIAAMGRDWKDALEKSSVVLQADPTGYPAAYYYNAVASYNLDDNEKAFESAQQAVRLDTVHAVPLAEQLLGVLFAAKGDYRSAAAQFRNYLAHAPSSVNVEAVKKALAEAESHLAGVEKK